MSSNLNPNQSKKYLIEKNSHYFTKLINNNDNKQLFHYCSKEIQILWQIVLFQKWMWHGIISSFLEIMNFKSPLNKEGWQKIYKLYQERITRTVFFTTRRRSQNTKQPRIKIHISILLAIFNQIINWYCNIFNFISSIILNVNCTVF